MNNNDKNTANILLTVLEGIAILDYTFHVSLHKPIEGKIGHYGYNAYGMLKANMAGFYTLYTEDSVCILSLDIPAGRNMSTWERIE